MRTSSILSVVVLTAGSAVVAGPAHAAPAPAPACGAVLTSDTRLRADLTCPEGDGLVLTAGVTLNLGGHTLTGSGAGTAIVLPNLGDVTIRNGTVAGWGTGVQTRDAWDEVGGTATIDRVTFTGNGSGVDTTGRLGGSGKVHLVSRSTFRDNGSGVSGVYGGAEVRRSTFTGNGIALDFITGGFLLEDSRVENNRVGASCDESGCEVVRSQLVGNEVALDVRFFGADVSDSTFRGNGTAFSSFSVWGHSALERNTFTDNGTAVTLSSSRATLVDNVFRSNRLGFTYEGHDPDWFGATLTGNRFVRNTDAIVVEEPGVALGDNAAERNTGWGIYAPQAEDLGGNTARGNGNEPQCVGVVCASDPTS